VVGSAAAAEDRIRERRSSGEAISPEMEEKAQGKAELVDRRLLAAGGGAGGVGVGRAERASHRR
jgi:hypothetical protein